jgi:hypothetical protein
MSPIGGRLEHAHFGDVLRALARDRRSGALHVFHAGMTAEINFDAGRIVAVHRNGLRAPDPPAALSHVVGSWVYGEYALRPPVPISRRMQCAPFELDDPVFARHPSDEARARIAACRDADLARPPPRAPGVPVVEPSSERRTMSGSLREVTLRELLDCFSRSYQIGVIALVHERRTAEISMERSCATGARIDGAPMGDVRGAIRHMLEEWPVGLFDLDPPVLDRTCLPIPFPELLEPR